MSAIITENFRRNNAALFLNDIISSTSSNKYYLGIGKQDQWSMSEGNSGFTVPVPIGSKADELEVLNNLNTLVKLRTLNGEVGRVIPSVPWVSGNMYKAYSSYDSSCFYPTGVNQPCYVTINGAIFMCLKSGSAPSTITPSVPATNKYAPFLLGATYTSGYVWVLVQEAPPTAIIRTSAFTDVRTVALTTELNDSKNQCGGLVTGFTVVNGGSGYSGTTPSVFRLRRNDGFSTGAVYSADDLTLTATILNGSVTAVSYSGDLLTTWRKGAVFASVEKTSGPGTGAVIIPTIAPVNGFAHIPANVMPSWFAGLAVKLDGDIETDNFYSRYRQISIVKNPTAILGQANASTLNALKYFTFDSSTTLPSVNINSSEIKTSDDSVIGWADHVVTTPDSNDMKRIYFHQNSASGYRELPSSGSIKIDGNSLTYDAINTGEFINDGTAEVLFTENRSFITRSLGQLEDLNLIIQF